MSHSWNRSSFIKGSLALTTGIGLTAGSGLLSELYDWVNDPLNNPMPTRPLGKTGHQVSLFSLGGQAAPQLRI